MKVSAGRDAVVTSVCVLDKEFEGLILDLLEDNSLNSTSAGGVELASEINAVILNWSDVEVQGPGRGVDGHLEDTRRKGTEMISIIAEVFKDEVGCHQQER